MNESVKRSPFVSYRYNTASLDLAVALLPIVFWSVFLFSWRALALVLVGTVGAVLLDTVLGLAAYKRVPRDLVSSAVIGTLVALSVSVDAPVWTVVSGCIAAVFVAKYSCAVFSLRTSIVSPAALGMLVASLVSGETETFVEFFRAGEMPGERLIDLVIGNIYGALGKVSVILALAAGLYLMLRRVVSPRVFFAATAVFAVLSLAFYPEWTTYTDNLVYQLLGGGFFFCLTFAVCDREGAPMTSFGKILYGAIFAALAFYLRCYTAVPQPELVGAVVVSILSPVIDRAFKGQPFGGKRKIK